MKDLLREEAATRVAFSTRRNKDRYPRALMIGAWFALAGAVFTPAPARATQVVATAAADNGYGIGWGSPTSIPASQYVGATEGVTIAIFNCPTPLHNLTVGPNDYLYLVSWSDDAGTQGIAGLFQPFPSGGVATRTGIGPWSVCATGFDVDFTAGLPNGPPLNGLPASSAINSRIPVCNANQGIPATSSVGWVPRVGSSLPGWQGGPPANSGGGIFPAMPCLNPASWMWFNPNPPPGGPILNPFAPGANHKEYLIFRIPMASVLNLPTFYKTKKFQNTTGQTVNDLEWLIKGTYPIVIDSSNGPFSNFQIVPSGTNTLIRFSGTGSVPPNGFATVSIAVPGTTLTTLGASWTINGVFAGCAHQVTFKRESSRLRSGNIVFANTATSCEAVGLYTGGVVVEWHTHEVALGDLTESAVRSPIRTDVIAGPPVAVAAGGESTLSIPLPPGGARFAVIRYTVGDSPTLAGPGNTEDIFQASLGEPTINNCQAGKVKCVSKYMAAVLKCHAKAAKTGTLDVLCLAKAEDKFDGGADPLKGCFEKLESKGGCLTWNDTATLAASTSDFVNDVGPALNPSFPISVVSKCLAGKTKCTNKLAAALLKCHAKAEQKGVLDPTCVQKAQNKYTGGFDPAKGCFAKLEAKSPCITTDDTEVLRGSVEVYVNNVVCHLDPTAATCPLVPCPSKLTFTGTSTGGVLDTGWTGQAHDAPTISDGTVTVAVTGCENAGAPCGVCGYEGPVENDPGQLQALRCTGDSSVTCTSDADCSGAGGTCKFFFGSYLPLAAGGVSTCVGNIFSGNITGTVNMDTGASAGTALVTSTVYSGPTLSQPCPVCAGDGTANDGVSGGTCSGGSRNGLSCDASGSSPNAAFGTTSLDCPPLTGGLIATLPIDLSNTTGTKTRTLSAANPSCRAIGFTGLKCQCDTCNNAAATPCSNNADCSAVGATICGGRRCAGGANNGTPCTVNSECPGGACVVPGAATAPNQCDDAICSPDPGTPSPNDGICNGGPFEQFCAPVETFRGCTSNADCPRPGDTCSLGKNRDCFDSGNIGDTVTATGNPDPPSGHQSDPTLAALFCIAPTSSAAVNGAAGLPGLGRLELTGHATDNGTP